MTAVKGKNVRFRGVVASAAVTALMCSLAPVGASAQSSSSGLMTVNSSGLVASVVGVAYNNGSLSTQIIIKNTNNVRVYIQDASLDSSQTAFLGSGESLDSPNVDGIPFCENSYASCSTAPNGMSMSDYSYIDPGNILGVALQYRADQKPSNPDTITFSLTMMARFAKSDADNSPDDVGPVREITLAFPYLSFTPKE